MLGPTDLPRLEFTAVAACNVNMSGVSYLPLNARWDVPHRAPMLAPLLLHPFLKSFLSQKYLSN